MNMPIPARWAAMLLLPAGMLACASSPPRAPATSPSAAAVPLPEPGHASPLPRAYDGAPPTIPHTIAGLSVTKDSNDCLTCHEEGAEVEPRHVATRVPASHYDGEKLSGLRYNCIQCHLVRSRGL